MSELLIDKKIEFTDAIGVELIERWGSDAKVAHAARTSTRGLDNQKGRVEGLVTSLWGEGHFSPFEHSGMTVAFDIPMFVRDHIVRHKSMSFSVRSGRYTEFEPRFYLAQRAPLVEVGRALDYERESGGEELRELKIRQSRATATFAWGSYAAQRAAGISKEEARTDLPASLYTQMWVTGNLRSWLHFLTARADPHAQHATAETALLVCGLIEREFPIAYSAWVAEHDATEYTNPEGGTR